VAEELLAAQPCFWRQNPIQVQVVAMAEIASALSGDLLEVYLVLLDSRLLVLQRNPKIVPATSLKIVDL